MKKTILVPRRLVVALAGVLLLLPVAMQAQAEDYRKNASTQAILHWHTGTYSILINDMGNQPDFLEAAKHARSTWRDALAADNGEHATLRVTDFNQVPIGAEPEIKFMKAAQGNTNGSSVTSDLPGTGSLSGHPAALGGNEQNPSKITFNIDEPENQEARKARACRAVGNVIGLGNVHDRNDCMNYQSHLPLPQRKVNVGPESVALVDGFYGPQIESLSTPSGNRSLIARDGKSVSRDRASQYAIRADVDGHALIAPVIKLDGNIVATGAAPTCSLGRCDATVTATAAQLDLASLAPGLHTVVAEARNEFGQVIKPDPIDFYVDTPARFGFHDNWHLDALQAGGTPATDPAQRVLPEPYKKAEELGVNTYRFVVPWNQVLPCSSAANWTRFDNAYKYSTTGGSRPVVVATIGGGNSPCHGYDPSDPPSPTNPANCTGAPPGDEDGNPNSYAPKADTAAYAETWKAYITALATRMPDALAIEIWNEPNVRHDWGYCNVSPSRYSTLVRQAQTALRAAQLSNSSISPDMTIATAGLSPSGSDTSASAFILRWQTYLEGVVASGVTDPSSTTTTADDVNTAVATHPYLRVGDCSGTIRREAAYAIDSQVTETRNLVGDTPVWITETGVSTSGNSSTDCRKAPNEEDQTRQLIDVIHMIQSKDIPVGILFRFAPSTVANTDPPDWFTEMTVLGENFNERDDGSGRDPYCGIADELDQTPALISCP